MKFPRWSDVCNLYARTVLSYFYFLLTIGLEPITTREQILSLPCLPFHQVSLLKTVLLILSESCSFDDNLGDLLFKEALRVPLQPGLVLIGAKLSLLN